MARRRPPETFADLLAACVRSAATDTDAKRSEFVAKLAGVTPRTLFAWRNGDGVRPHEITLRAVATVLSVDAERVRKAVAASRNAKE